MPGVTVLLAGFTLAPSPLASNVTVYVGGTYVQCAYRVWSPDRFTVVSGLICVPPSLAVNQPAKL